MGHNIAEEYEAATLTTAMCRSQVLKMDVKVLRLKVSFKQTETHDAPTRYLNGFFDLCGAVVYQSLQKKKEKTLEKQTWLNGVPSEYF